MKQTAVEYLVEELKKIGFSTNNIVEFENEVQIAKEMEKQQIIESHAVGRLKECSGINTDGEQYYNQTFKHQAQ
jgi:hypothetical protein